MNKSLFLVGACFLLPARLAGADDAFGTPNGGGTKPGGHAKTQPENMEVAGSVIPEPVIATASPASHCDRAYTPQARDGSLSLTAEEADLVGKQLRVADQDPLAIGDWYDQSESIKWLVKVNQPGAFNVIFNYSLDPACNGSVVVLSADGGQLCFTPPATASWNNFQRQDAGQVTLKNTGLQEINLTAAQKPGLAVMTVHSITLVPMKAAPHPRTLRNPQFD